MRSKMTIYYPDYISEPDEDEESKQLAYEESDHEPGFTVQENELLDRLAAGEFDGFVGKPRTSSNGVTIFTAIQDGIPQVYTETPNERELIKVKVKRTLGTMIGLQLWGTEEKKLKFLKEYGKEINDDEVQAYAAQKADEADEKNKSRRILIEWIDGNYNPIGIYPMDSKKLVQ